MNSEPPLVSIITPTYNHERFIRQCIESAMAQTDPRWEQFVIDDGSRDGTEQVVRSIQDERVHYIRLPHRGIMALSESYNIALDRACGEFIAVLEGDDFWPPDKIERQIRSFGGLDIALNFGRVVITDEAGDFLKTAPSVRAIVRAQGRSRGDTLRELLQDNFIPAGTVMCRRASLVEIGGFQQPRGIPTTDYPTWLALCRVGEFSASPDNLGYQRNHPLQATQRFRATMDQTLESGTRFIEQLSEADRRALGVSIDDARNYRRRRRAYLAYEAARSALVIKDRAAAIYHFRNAVRAGSWPTRAKAAIGLTCTLMGLDFEAVVRVAHRMFN